MVKNFIKPLLTLAFAFFCLISNLKGQESFIDFNTIPKSGTILIYAHQDDDLIWMLPFWNITEKFIGGAMPATPNFRLIVHDQQIFLNNNGYRNIQYESNWITPWTDISDTEYSEYYWWNNTAYYYLSVDHLKTKMANDNNPLTAEEINKIKAKLEQYIARPDVVRVITHNNWGEYGHQHHRAINKAVRELAVKYHKDVWILGCHINYKEFIDIDVPDGIPYTLANFNTPNLFIGIRNIYQKYYRWTWYIDEVPSGSHKFIKIVNNGNDKSNILTGETITYPGPTQNEQGAYIFDGVDDYMTLRGNNYSPFTIAMRIRPDQIKEMDIARMAEYPLYEAAHDKDFYMTSDGRITARIYDGTSKTITSNLSLNASVWAHIAITYDGSSLKLYVNGALQKSINTGTPIINYTTPELVLGQAANTGSFFAGQINDVQMYNRALTDAEVADISRMIFTLNSSAGSGGTIYPSGIMTVNAGSSMTFNIIPNAGYRLANVLIDNVPAGPVSTYTFNLITSNHSIYATFEPISYSIQANAGIGGAITPSGNIIVMENGNQSFSITPDTGFVTSDVKIDNVSIGAVSSYTFSDVTADHTISACFNPIAFIISSSSGTGGSIDPQGEIIVNYGQNKTFTIDPGVGFKIADVFIDGTSIGPVNKYTFNKITSNHSISVSFKPVTFTVYALSDIGGSIIPSGNINVNYGDNKTFTFIPDEGYEVSDVKVDNKSIGPVQTYTFYELKSDHKISVSYKLKTYVISILSTGGGTTVPAGRVYVEHGSDYKIIFKPFEGYKISNIKINNKPVVIDTIYFLKSLSSDCEVLAVFSPLTKYEIKVTAGEGGLISPVENITVFEGSNITLAITPLPGFRISYVLVDNKLVGQVPYYTFKDINSNHEISAEFINTIEYKVFPNPFYNYFNLEILSPEILKFDVSIIDLRGNQILLHKDIPSGKLTEFRMNIKPGVYFVKVSCRGTHMKTIKVIKMAE